MQKTNENETISAVKKNVSIASGTTGDESGFSCTAWVLQQNNTDYLRCASKFSWNSQTYYRKP